MTKFLSALLLLGLLAGGLESAGAVQHGSPGGGAAPSERTAPVASPRGELLYENHCLGCHTSRAHLRSDRRATSVADVERQVRRWANELGLGWTDEDVTQVTEHLLDRYYRFDAPSAR